MGEKDLSCEEAEMVKKEAERKLIIIIGRNESKNIIGLIPEADRFMKHSSTCFRCKRVANFTKNDRAVCRECKRMAA